MAAPSQQPGHPPRLVLASASPRRHELLAGLGFEFAVVVSDVDESVRAGEDPVAYVQRVALAKARAVATRRPAGDVVVAADTTVAVDGLILAKPADDDEARAMLTMLSGRSHLVHTGVVVARAGDGQPAPLTRAVTTEVCFDELDAATIDGYVATGEPFDKAGAYAVQGRGGALVREVHGSVTNVVGLPLVELREMLRTVGVNCW